MANIVLDPTRIVTGFQGELYDSNGIFIAEVNTWHAQFTVTNADYQPAGRAQRVAILTGWTAMLTFTETVIRDDRFLAIIGKALTGTQLVDRVAVIQPSYSFQGQLHRNPAVGAAFNLAADNSVYVFNNCVPDGTLDIANVAPGDVLHRSWNWRVNGLIDLRQTLSAV